MVVEVISEIDEIISGEGESAVGEQQLIRCKAKLKRLAKKLSASKPGDIVNGAEMLLLISQAVRLVYKWVKKN